MAEPPKVPVDIDGMERLYIMAKQNGTLGNWAIVALTWMKAANKEIERLNAKLLTVSCETKEE